MLELGLVRGTHLSPGKPPELRPPTSGGLPSRGMRTVPSLPGGSHIPVAESNLSPLELSPPNEGGFPRGFEPSDCAVGAPSAPASDVPRGSASGAPSTVTLTAASSSDGAASVDGSHMPLWELNLSPFELRLPRKAVRRGAIGPVGAGSSG